jgi:hypothetical protein
MRFAKPHSVLFCSVNTDKGNIIKVNAFVDRRMTEAVKRLGVPQSPTRKELGLAR